MTKTLIIAVALTTLALPALACAQDAHHASLPPHPAHAGAHPRTASAAHTPPARAHDVTRAAPTRPPRPTTAVDGQVNLNTATVDELMRIPGIGPVKARAILATRARQPNGRYYRLEDVLRVHGIGRATLRRLRDVFVLTGPTTLRASTAPPPTGLTHAERDEDAASPSARPVRPARTDAATTTPREPSPGGVRVRSDDDI